MMSEFLALRPNSKFALRDWFQASAFNVCSTFLFPKQEKEKKIKEREKEKEGEREKEMVQIQLQFSIHLHF